MSDEKQQPKEVKAKTSVSQIQLVPLQSANKPTTTDYRAANAAKAREAKRPRDEGPTGDIEEGDDEVEIEETSQPKKKRRLESSSLSHKQEEVANPSTVTSIILGIAGDGARLFVTCLAAAGLAYLKTRVSNKGQDENVGPDRGEIERWTV